MATKSLAVEVNITSLKDVAYKQALISEQVEGVAQYAIDHIVGFPEALPDEAKAQLYDGYRLRFNEKNKPDQYAVIDDHYIKLDGSNPKLADEREKVNIGTDYAFSFTQQQFGKLKNDNPYLHAVIKEWRDKVNNYCSNRLSDLKRQARTIKARGTKRERGHTADFAKRVADTFSDLATKCKNAKARGDESANEAKFSQAKIAFMVAWNK